MDSGCSNYMTSDKMFKKLWNSEKKKVRIGNGECLAVKGNGVIAITSGSRTKLITYVLYVPDIDRNLLRSINGKWIQSVLQRQNLCDGRSIRR